MPYGQVKKKSYVDLHVGDVVRFGQYVYLLSPILLYTLS